jgi:outer membrane receptor protein involved in Fe transport
MMSRVFRQLFVICIALLAVPVMVHGQEATLTGTVTDATGAVLPGVTVTALHEATGNRFTTVTDGLGKYLIPARIGNYRITAELTGFTTVEATGVTLLVGQTAAINLQMKPSTVSETVTVTGESPLIDITQSSLGGNIDSKQMEELPVQGRQWTSLALLAPGNRTTAMGTGQPIQDRNDGEVREFQLNLDGQQITSNLGTGNQPLYSRDSIAEFQFISNRFDATQGRSAGVQVNAITKSGTNQFSGSFGSYFRDDAFNSADPVLGYVLPFSNQQYSTTVGGPIVTDKLHFFGNFEYERAPRSTAWNTRYPAFNIELAGTNTRKMGGGRVDYQMSPNTRLMGKGHAARRWDPFTDGNANHPAGTSTTVEESREFLGQLTQVLSNRALNEIKGGYAKFLLSNYNLTTWDSNLQADVTGGLGGPRIRFQGFQVPGNANHPRTRYQEMYNLRDDFTVTRGRHDLKVGGEYLFYHELTQNRRNANYVIDAAGVPPPANLPAILPQWDNADTWNLNALNPSIRRITIGVGDFNVDFNQHRMALWVQDDWRTGDRLTLNLGLRYDLTTNGFANDAAFPPFVESGRPNDTNNIQPRFGFAYQITDRTVFRGGTGIYYGDTFSADANWMYGNTQIATIQIQNDGRPDFATNPFNGRPLPTYDEAQRLFCHVNNAPGCLFAAAQELAPPGEFGHHARSWQTSAGLQHQFGTDLAVEADYVYTDVINEKMVLQNINLTYLEATGANIGFSQRLLRPFPNWGVVSMSFHQGLSDYHGLQMALTKRFRNRWQGAATYTLSRLQNNEGLPHSGVTQVAFDVAPDLGNEWSNAITDQRHRMVLNGIYDFGWGFQMSGLYFFGSGERYDRSYGGDLRDFGTDAANRLRPDGTIAPRNEFVGDSVHRVDLRFQKRFTFGRNLRADGIVEVHNLFDRSNYGTYITEESSPQFGDPDVNPNIAYGPRVFTFGFRFQF